MALSTRQKLLQIRSENKKCTLECIMVMPEDFDEDDTDAVEDVLAEAANKGVIEPFIDMVLDIPYTSIDENHAFIG